MAAACFPEEQAKVHAELDAVVGKHRGKSTSYCSSIDAMISPQVPTFADQQSLPRLNALISEALRWRPSAANGGNFVVDSTYRS